MRLLLVYNHCCHMLIVCNAMKEEVVSDDGNGIVDDPRSGQQQKARERPKGLDGESRLELGQDEKGSNIGKQEALDKRSEELLAAVDILDAASEDELESAGIILSSESKSVSFSGLLPHPDVHKLYDPETRERICRWNDAFTIDESKRQDRLVDNEIEQAKRGPILSMIMLTIFSLLAFVSFLVTRETASFWFLAVTVVSVIGNLIVPVFSKSSRGRRR